MTLLTDCKSGRNTYCEGRVLIVWCFFLSWKSLCQSCYFLISSLSPILEESNCSYVQQKLYKAFQGVTRAEDLAVTGSALSAHEEEWTTILIHNCSVQVI